MRMIVAAGMILAAIAGCGKKSDELTLKGSDTMLHVGEAWTEQFKKDHPEIRMSVTGGGSGTGISAIINGHTQIAMSSRYAEPNEIQAAVKLGKALKEFEVGKDGIAVIVSRNNPVSELTLDQLRKIFTGAVTNWKQVGGQDREIIIYSRDTSSGSYVFFREHVLAKKEFAKAALRMASTAVLVESVAGNEAAIGYSGLAYAQDANVRILAVKAVPEAEAVTPTFETIRDGSYAIGRPLLLYTLGEPQGRAKTFIDFTLSDKGQRILKEIGYVPVR